MATTRRRFLQHSGALTLAAGTQLATLPGFSRAAPGDDYKALVCILLAGGADSFNMLIPYDTARHDAYRVMRADLALPRADILPLNYSGTDGRQFALHPGMGEVRDLFDSGDLAFLANVGSLAEPTDRVAYDSGSALLPLGLFSHSDQIAQWQTSVPDRRIATGFGGRMADVLQPMLPSGPVSMNISLSGTNLFQTGTEVTGYSVDAVEGVREVAGYGSGEGGSPLFTGALDALLAIPHADPFRSTYSAELRDAIDSGAQLRAALAAAPVLNTVFSAGGLSAALARIARIISVRDQLGVSRQTFFVTLGGWDHHDDVLPQQAAMLPGVSRGLSEFHSALTELGVSDCVTTFTISDFGRTLTSNGKGSDHGWGGHNLVMGAGVSGRNIYGSYPEIVPGNPLDVGRGRYIPTTGTDLFYAELALWFGVAPVDLDRVLPNIRRFYSPESGTPPLGLMI
ncbi:MAG: DUF1501 domain-containing protein [Pseudomonadales bacterium]|nr:DUF1501 domain-containing protein [Pseudomonadales bacterium]